MKLEITYDPYRMSTKMIVDGRDIATSISYEKFKKFIDQGLPLQSWIDPIAYNNWHGFVSELIGDSQESVISCTFRGRKLDYSDFKASIESQCAKMQPPIEFKITPRYTMDDENMLENINMAVELMQKKDFQNIIEDPLLNATLTLKNAYTNLSETYRKATDGEFRIVFAGMYSSGKSTIINAIVGKEILPTSDGTCTSKIFEIRHDKDVKFVKMCCLDKLGKKIVPSAKYDYRSLGEKFAEIFPHGGKGELLPSSPPEIETVQIWTDLSNLYPKQFYKKLNIVLVDTPGTSSGEGNDIDNGPAHIDITSEIVGSPNKEMVVFTSSAIEDKDDSIKEFLQIIDETSGDSKDYNQRFLFVLNKADACRFKPGETFKEKLGSVESYYTKDRPSMEMPRFFPVSALSALEVRLGRTSGADYKGIREHYVSRNEDEDSNWTPVADCENYFFDKYCSISEKAKEAICSEIQAIQRQNIKETEKFAQEILLHSGIPALEIAIQDYIERYAVPLKIRALLNTFDGILNETSQMNNLVFEKLKNLIGQKQSSVNSKNAREAERRVNEERSKNVNDARSEIETKLQELERSDITTKIENAIGNEKVEMRKKLQTILACKEAKYESAEEGKRSISLIFDQTSSDCSKQINRLGDDYKDQLSNITGQVKDLLDSVKDAIHMDSVDFSFENTVAYQTVTSDLLEQISPARHWVSNPDMDYSGWNIFKHLKKLFIDDIVADGFKFDESALQNYVDEAAKTLNSSLDPYKEKLICNLTSIFKSIKASIKNLFDEIKKIDRQLCDISDQINELSGNITDIENGKKKLELYQAYILAIQKKIQQTKLQEGEQEYGQ